MYTDNYGNSTKYIYMYMIVLDYIHTQRYWSQNKRVRVWRTNTNEEEEEENKGQGKDGYIPRWHAVKSMYTGSGGMLRSRSDQDRLGINEDKTERFCDKKIFFHKQKRQ